MEIALAERLGVSRTPVREAMRKLELEGLVVMIPRRGAQVANITEKDLNDVLEVRIALENLSIENACARMTEEQLAELWKAAIPIPSSDIRRTMSESSIHPVRTIVPVLSAVSRMPCSTEFSMIGCRVSFGI